MTRIPKVKYIGGIAYRHKKTVSTKAEASAWMKKEKTPRRIKSGVKGVKMWSTSIPKCRIVKGSAGYICYSTRR